MNCDAFLNQWRASAGFAFSAPARQALEAPEFREQLYRALGNQADSWSGLLRECFALEMRYRRQFPDGEHYEGLYWCALLLFEAGAVEDCLAMWAAKQIDFDTGCGFDIQFLLGAGIDATVAFLKASDSPDAPAALARILAGIEGGEFEQLEGWLEHRREYFR